MPPDALVWIAIGILVALATAVVLLARIERRLRGLETPGTGAEALERIAATVQTLGQARAELDLRRLEHVLIDIRDGQKRVEDRMLASLESRHATAAGASAIEPAAHALASTLAERIVTRLLALGYERIQFVTPVSDVQKLSAADGEVSIEARRDGAPCKGRVVVRGGTIADLQLQSAYSIFP